MSEEIDTKYASEVERFIDLFQVFGRSLAGLLLLEIGWTLVLVLAARLATDQANTPRMQVGSVGITLSSLWVVGALAVLFGWAVAPMPVIHRRRLRLTTVLTTVFDHS